MSDYRIHWPKLAAWLSLMCLLVVGIGAASASAPVSSESTPPSSYVADFISTAATGLAMNDAGDVIGTSYTDPGCGPFCLPPLETVVWRAGQRIVLPTVPGFTNIYVRSINNQGWIVGLAGVPGTTTHAAVWKPVGDSYQVIDLGALPGHTVSEAIGIDNTGRVIGWSTTLNFPPNTAPFVWTEATGLVNLAAQGFPNEKPLAISPGGTVATPGYWYRLGEPGSVTPMPTVPPGFYPPGSDGAAINDAGDQARFLVSTSAQNLRYLFRFHHEGTWQQLSTSGNGNLSVYGVGSINAARDVTGTLLSAGVIAYGPDGLAQPMTPLLAPSYQGSAVSLGGPQNSSGQILARVIIGQSARVMRLEPATPCTSGCIRVSALQVTAQFVEDPQDPGHCSPGGNAYNTARVKVRITNESGAKLRKVQVTGRIMDDYWTNQPVSGMTNFQGVVNFKYQGPCGVGAIAFVVEDAVRTGLVFDKSVGVMSGYAIPTLAVEQE